MTGSLSRAAVVVVVLSSLGGACRKDRVATSLPSSPVPPNGLAAPRFDLGALTARVGVKPGPLAYPRVGPAASLMETLGAVAVRRAGEARFVDATVNVALYAGDTVWTSPHAQATVALADNTLVQMAEETVVAIGNRAFTSDPASSAAVLYGVARLSISPRARGEGAFVTMAGPTLIGAKGTVFGVAVTANGQVRVGVEHGEAEVAGAAALDKPLTLETAQSIVVEPKGVLGKIEAFRQDDWGDWRFAAEARGNALDVVARLHANRLVRTESSLDAAYQLLRTLGTTASTLTWQAEAHAKPKGAGDLKNQAVDHGAAIEAVYRLSLEVARLTNAALSDAFILTELYARHPEELEAQFMEFGQEAAAALLYNKKLQVVSEVFLAPLRPIYYAHTARGRARAAALGLQPVSTVTQVKLPEVSAAELAKRLPANLYVPPRLDSTTKGHPVWQRAPALGWNERLTLQPVPARQGSWYLAPKRVEGYLVAGVAPRGPLTQPFETSASTEPGETELGFLIPPFPPLSIAPDAGAAP